MGEMNIIRIQIMAVFGSACLIILIINLIRKKRLREEFSILWLATGFIFFVISVFRRLLDKFSYFLGIDYPPAALFLVLIVGLILILVHFSVAISRLKEDNKKLLQEIGLLKAEMEQSVGREK